MLVSPMEPGDGLKPTLGWSSTITLFSLNDRLSSVRLKGLVEALPRVDRTGYLDFGSGRAWLDWWCIHDGMFRWPRISSRSSRCEGMFATRDLIRNNVNYIIMTSVTRGGHQRGAELVNHVWFRICARPSTLTA